MNVTIIGSGTMGNGIAHVFAQHHHAVVLCDTNKTQLELALKTITTNLDRQIKNGKISEFDKIKTLENIRFENNLNLAVIDASLVVEAITENFDIKSKLFTQLDKLTSQNTILASNTSSISISDLADCTSKPENVIGMHFFNPVPVMQLVEIIKGKKTSSSTLEAITQLTSTLNKIPIVVNDFPGFVSNRVLMPMINEAILALEEGVAEIEAIDQVVKLGLAHPMGPLQLADFIGLDVCLNIMRVLHQGFENDKYKPANLLAEMVKKGELGKKSGKGFYTYS